ncbi:glycosyl hydrolase family 28 protein [Paraburkholderia sp. PGU19]|uniref:glycosyl hydrolase family 28 protein n=1 Tax=Paraburkholderia sp. PGU19 TaxID=2735434 RepID=UPI001FB14061|nr:glycosyl hydrolase family 28 protein [Paraburkholderia sp. PGU19]
MKRTSCRTSRRTTRVSSINNGSNFTLYRVTLQNAPKFHVVPSGVQGFTAWGVKIYTPTAAYEAMNNYKGVPYSTVNAKNTDGIDPASSGPVTSNPEGSMTSCGTEAGPPRRNQSRVSMTARAARCGRTAPGDFRRGGIEMNAPHS